MDSPNKIVLIISIKYQIGLQISFKVNNHTKYLSLVLKLVSAAVIFSHRCYHMFGIFENVIFQKYYTLLILEEVNNYFCILINWLKNPQDLNLVMMGGGARGLIIIAFISLHEQFEKNQVFIQVKNLKCSLKHSNIFIVFKNYNLDYKIYNIYIVN